MSMQQTRAGWLRADASLCEPVRRPNVRACRLVLLGPPGVGKGTQAALLSKQLRACHLSTGELFRSAACESNPSAAMSAALEVMRRGELVSDELVLNLVRERNQCLRCRGGFLLDGVPRTLAQAEALEGMLDELQVGLDAVLSYELELEAIIDRLGGRRTCGDCGAVFHLTSSPPQQQGTCDLCQGALFQREDDRPDTIRVRMRTYQQATQPLRDFYARRNQLIPISAHGTPAEIFDRTLIALSRQRVRA